MRNTLTQLLHEVRDLKTQYSQAHAIIRGFAAKKPDGNSLEDFFLTQVEFFTTDQVECYIEALREEKGMLTTELAEAHTIINNNIEA